MSSALERSEAFWFIFIEGFFGVLFGLGLAWDCDLLPLNERHFLLFDLIFLDRYGICRSLVSYESTCGVISMGWDAGQRAAYITMVSR